MDLEDSVASLPPLAEAGEEVVKPRKLGRLRKAGAVENAQPNRAAAPASPGQLGGKPAQDAVQCDQEGHGSPAAPGEDADAAASDDAGAASASPQVQADGSLGGDAQQKGGEDEQEQEEDKDSGYYDEEDELEQHFVQRATQGAPGAAASAEASEDEDEGPAGSELSGGSARSGSPGTMELLATDTQRILRETAARDRLGKGHKIEVKPLSSILGRIKERQALAIARAPKPALPNVGSFDEILAEAQQQAGGGAATAAAAGAAGPGPNAAADGEQPSSPVAAGAQGDAAAGAPVTLPAAGPAEAAAEGDGDAAEAEDGEGEVGDDLLIMDSDEEGSAEVRLVELPSTGKKKKPRMPFFTQENSYEDEMLIDDGYDSEEEDLEQEEEEEQGAGSQLAAENSSEAEEEGEEEEAVGNGEAGSAGGDSPAGSEEAAAGSQPERARRQGSVEPSAAKDEQQDEAMEDVDAEPSCASGEAAAAALAAPAVPKRVKKMQRMFLDMEAELSDEEEGGAHSEDESEDLDDQGELAGLIGAAKETAKDGRLRQQLHRQWAEQKDEKELQQLMAGLKNGFRRRRGGGFFDDEDDELAGRRRRARTDGDEEDGADGVLPWPSPFEAPAGSDDEAEDEELLRKAKEGLLLAESGKGLEEGGGSGRGGSAGGLSASGSGGIPLDEGSQELLGLLLARSASEPQRGGGGAGGGSGAGRSRFAPAGAAAAALPTFGSDPSNNRLAVLPGAGSQSRGPSFVGRQPAAVRGASSSNLGAGGRSFVFARDDSQGAPPADKGGSGEGGAAAAADAGSQGPTSFANLRQMAGMPGTSAAAGQQQQRKRAGSCLVSRLKPPGHRAGKEPVASQPADPAASAAAAAAAVAVMAGGGRRAK